MKYLVTGGAGFIGSNIVRRLLTDGHHVRVLDDFSSGREENLAEIASDIELIKGNICNRDTVAKAVVNIEVVLHQAALPSVPRSIKDPISSNEVNVRGTLNLLEESRRAGVERFVAASSSSVYGESEELPKHEGMIPHPLSPYAITKLVVELYCRIYWELYQFPTVALRYFNIFGPRQDPGSEYSAVIPRFITLLQNGKRPVVFGDGEQSRDFTYIENAVDVNLLAATEQGMVGKVFNVGCGAQYTLNQLLDNLRNIIGVSTEAQYDPPRQGDIRHSFAAIDKIEKFGYRPKFDFNEGLKKTVEFSIL